MFVLPTEARALLQDGRSIRGPGGLVLRGVPDGRIAYDGGGTAESGDVLWAMLRVSGRTSDHILCRFTIRDINKCSLDGSCKLCTSILSLNHK